MRKLKILTLLASVVAVMISLCGVVLADTSAQTVVGDWNGTLVIPTGQLPLVFHFTNANGNLAATLDSPAQNSYGMTSGSVSFSNNTITSTFPIVHGTFTGTVSSDGKTIAGSWSQGSSLPLTLTRVLPVALPAALDGSWSGTLSTPQGSLRLILLFHRNSTGAATVSLQSPDQGPGSYPASSVTDGAGSIAISFPSIGGAYVGTLSSDSKTLTGRWSQGGGSVPLVLSPSH